MHVALIGAELEENLAIRYLWGALVRAGHEVSSIVFDGPEQTERAARELCDSGAELAGMSLVFTWRAREFALLAERARQLGYRGHLVAGGHFAAFNAETLLADVPALDSVACGEGEPILVAMAAGLDALGAVEGLVWRDGAAIVRNAPADKPPDLDALAEPVRKPPFDAFVGLPMANMLSSRGCLHACSFCSIAAWHKLCGGQRLRLRRPDRVADEMARLYRQGVRIFNFHDDNFVLRDRDAMLARLDALAAGLRARGVGPIAMAIKSRPNTVDEAVFARLKRMGTFRVFLGIEAGTATSLRQLGRGQTLADNEHALAVVNRLDLHACFNLLLLNPDSTLEDLAANVAFLRAHPHNPMNFCRTEVYAGTPLEHRLRREGRLRGDYWGYGYEIADPRAQAAFEVIFEAFETRNYGEHALHHRAMHVDYEHQLVSDFHGRDEELRREVKRFVADVNLNTCEHLESILAALAAAPAGADHAALRRVMKGRVEADNDGLMQRGDALLDAIRGRADRLAALEPTWARAATAAGLAVALTLSLACDSPAPVPMPEMAPAPTAPERPDAAPDAAGPGPGTGSVAPVTGASELIQAQFEAELLPFLAEAVVPARPLEIALTIDPKGRVSNVELLGPPLGAELARGVTARLASWRATEPRARGLRFVLLVTATQLEHERARSGPVPAPEMAPRPPRPEMAPRPPPRPEMAPRPR
ncbi:MAG: cobalamin B12-binding domain-containing protein [Myxococcales bacterium]|nr:cobalamin B12-binding domain-containing protein [Myxococcales bacterium]